MVFIFSEDTLKEKWNSFIRFLKSKNALSSGQFPFLEMVQLELENDGTLKFTVPDEHTKSLITKEIHDDIITYMSAKLDQAVKINITINPDILEELDIFADSDDNLEDNLDPEFLATNSPRDKQLQEKILRESHLNANYTFDTFVIGSSNRFAHAAARAVAENPIKTYNPLFIYGGSGLGKTHLLHAIGHYTLNLYPHTVVKYVNSEEFTNEFINAVSTGHAHEFQQRYRGVDLLLIDDIQFLQGKEQTLEEFFHTFNSLHNSNKQIVITSDLHPKYLEGFEERLRTRFEWGLLTDVHSPDLETRIAILQNMTRRENVSVPNDVMNYIASRIITNIRELEGNLRQVTAYAALTSQPVTLELAQTVLKDTLGEDETVEITVEIIQKETANYYDVSIEEIMSSARSRQITLARQIAMYLCRELTDLSLPAVGKEFGGRDHTTVMHANKKITQLMKSTPQIFEDISQLTNMIKETARRG